MKCFSMFAPLFAMFGLAAVMSAPAMAQTVVGNRAFLVEDMRNDQAAFMVRVGVDKPDRVYRVGDTPIVGVVSEKEGYLYLFYAQADDKIALIFPNSVQPDNKIPAKTAIAIPSAKSEFRFRVGEPTGKEVLKAVVTLKPLKAEEIEQARRQFGAPIKGETTRALYVESLKPQPRGWAEHSVEITTLKPGQAVSTQQRRVAVCIGISDFRDDRVRDLSICHKDAEAMADLLKKQCGFEHVVTLTNQQGTRANIEKAIRKELVERTRPGDEVILYWSGHGGRIADDNGDEKDGYDEVLVPYDADLTNIDTQRSSMVVDDAFGHWIQALDGRKVLLILDTCHSGGQAANGKGVSGLDGGQNLANVEFDFLDQEMTRAKDIGQKDAALLASSTARQISFERRDGNLSVMTHFLVQHVKEAPGQVTLSELFGVLEKAVPKYVAETEPGATQTPVLINEIKPFLVKP